MDRGFTILRHEFSLGDRHQKHVVCAVIDVDHVVYHPQCVILQTPSVSVEKAYKLYTVRGILIMSTLQIDPRGGNSDTVDLYSISST